MTGPGRLAWPDAVSWYDAGYSAGLERGGELADAEAAAQWRAVAESVRALARRPDRAELAGRGHILRDLTRPPALPPSWWTTAERRRSA